MNETELQQAFEALADHGGIDEHQAWERIQAGIAADRKAANRRRTYLTIAGLAVAGSAAAAFVVVAGQDQPEAVETVTIPDTTPDSTPASVPATVPAPTTTAPTAVVEPPAGELPARAIAVASADAQSILLVDGDTGEVVRTMYELPDDRFTITDLELAPDGRIYVQVNPPDSFTEEPDLADVNGEVVYEIGPDGEATTVMAPGVVTHSPAVSADGRLLAFVARAEGTVLAIIDRVTGDQRTMAWAADEEDFFLTNGFIDDLAFSPDGTQLMFSSSYEGTDVLVLDLDTASTLSDAEIVGGGVTDATWLPDGRIVGIDTCCYPEHDRNLGVVVVDQSEEPTVLRDLTPRALAGGSGGLWAQVDEGIVRIGDDGTDTGWQPDLGDPGALGPFFVIDVL